MWIISKMNIINDLWKDKPGVQDKIYGLKIVSSMYTTQLPWYFSQVYFSNTISVQVHTKAILKTTSAKPNYQRLVPWHFNNIFFKNLLFHCLYHQSYFSKTKWTSLPFASFYKKITFLIFFFCIFDDINHKHI